MRCATATAGLLACLALLAAGCGSDDSDTSGGATTAATSESGDGGTDAGSGGSADSDDSGSNGSGSAGPGGDGGSGGAGGGNLSPAQLTKEFEAPKNGDNSIQTFGEVAEGGEEEEIVSTMRAFFKALANRDYAAICAALSEGNHQQLELYLKAEKKQGGCEAALKAILVRQGDEPEKALRGSIYQVRVEDDNAFVLFVPAGGDPSYFVMKREGDAWKSTSVAAGIPLNPSAVNG